MRVTQIHPDGHKNRLMNLRNMMVNGSKLHLHVELNLVHIRNIQRQLGHLVKRPLMGLKRLKWNGWFKGKVDQ